MNQSRDLEAGTGTTDESNDGANDDEADAGLVEAEDDNLPSDDSPDAKKDVAGSQGVMADPATVTDKPVEFEDDESGVAE